MAKKVRIWAVPLLAGVLALSLVRLAVLAVELLPGSGMFASGAAGGGEVLGWCAAAVILVIGAGALAALGLQKESDRAEEEA